MLPCLHEIYRRKKIEPRSVDRSATAGSPGGVGWGIAEGGSPRSRSRRKYGFRLAGQIPQRGMGGLERSETWRTPPEAGRAQDEMAL
jgi:hypothetical protein